MSFYLPPNPEHSRLQDMIDSHRMLCAEAIKEYLYFIGIQLKNIETIYHSSSGNMFSTYPTSHMRINCVCDITDYKYFERFSHIIARTKHPKINKDALYGHLYPSGPGASIFEYNVIVDFEFKIDVGTIQNMNDAIFMLKEATEELRYRKYSNSFDEEVLKELDSNT
ncbi:hypothetical protein UFOVP53_17 [uncultured Caudovirales phage]|uniref:Uncharacterized protein n=1 Tax=uncultured Caudovirales phage TaxID=2100421 RepID=A0A6J5KRV6_9CAUD|nr:hypothetical protein UFOVP53_17 [uncultured Caudovirales phage]